MAAAWTAATNTLTAWPQHSISTRARSRLELRRIVRVRSSVHVWTPVRGRCCVPSRTSMSRRSVRTRVQPTAVALSRTSSDRCRAGLTMDRTGSVRPSSPRGRLVVMSVAVVVQRALGPRPTLQDGARFAGIFPTSDAMRTKCPGDADGSRPSRRAGRLFDRGHPRRPRRPGLPIRDQDPDDRARLGEHPAVRPRAGVASDPAARRDVRLGHLDGARRGRRSCRRSAPSCCS